MNVILKFYTLAADCWLHTLAGIVATKQDYNLWMRINSKFIIIETVNFKALISYLVPAC